MSEHLSDTNVGNIEYIRKQEIFDALEKVASFFPYKIPGNADTYDKYNEAWNDAIGRTEMEIESIEPADVIPVSAYKQVMWERDTAVEQLKQIGKGLGEVMDDVVSVVRCDDCKYYGSRRWCELNSSVFDDNAFCSYGERREE